MATCEPFTICALECATEPFPPNSPTGQTKLMKELAPICQRKGIELPTHEEGYSTKKKLVYGYIMVGKKQVLTEATVRDLGGWQTVEDSACLPSPSPSAC